MSVSISWDEWRGQWLASVDLDELDESQVQVSPENAVGVGGLLRAWWEHVSKLVSDLSVPPNDHGVWGAHDYLAALIIRDRLAEGLSHIDPKIMRAVAPAVTEADKMFEGYVEMDADGCASRIDGRSHSAKAWWWERVPKAGPVRDEIEQYYGHIR